MSATLAHHPISLVVDSTRFSVDPPAPRSPFHRQAIDSGGVGVRV